MFLVWVRTVASDTESSRAMSGPSSSLSEEPQDLQLPFAEWLDQWLIHGRSRSRRSGSGQEQTRVPRTRPALSRPQPQQCRHGRAFVDEDADVAFGLSQRQGALERHQRARHILAGATCERLEDQDLDHAPGPAAGLRRGQQARQETRSPLGGVVGRDRAPPGPGAAWRG